MSEQDKYESDAEEYEDYKPTGYHPAYIGENFKEGRYKIVQKLGWGYFSTVWMAYDKETNKNVALKIQKSKDNYAEAAEDEIELLQQLNSSKNSKEWEETRAYLNKEKNMNLTKDDIYNIEIIDNFVHYGMHGKHYCSTFDIMGPNLLDIMTYFDDEFEAGIPIPIVKKIAKQMMIALDYMHRMAGIIHTDLKPENIMIELPKSKMAAFEEQIAAVEKLPLSMKFLEELKKNTTGKKKRKKRKRKKKPAPANDGGDDKDSVSQPQSTDTDTTSQSGSILSDKTEIYVSEEKKASEKKVDGGAMEVENIQEKDLVKTDDVAVVVADNVDKKEAGGVIIQEEETGDIQKNESGPVMENERKVASVEAADTNKDDVVEENGTPKPVVDNEEAKDTPNLEESGAQVQEQEDENEMAEEKNTVPEEVKQTTTDQNTVNTTEQEDTVSTSTQQADEQSTQDILNEDNGQMQEEKPSAPENTPVDSQSLTEEIQENKQDTTPKPVEVNSTPQVESQKVKIPLIPKPSEPTEPVKVEKVVEEEKKSTGGLFGTELNIKSNTPSLFSSIPMNTPKTNDTKSTSGGGLFDSLPTKSTSKSTKTSTIFGDLATISDSTTSITHQQKGTLFSGIPMNTNKIDPQFSKDSSQSNSKMSPSDVIKDKIKDLNRTYNEDDDSDYDTISDENSSASGEEEDGEEEDYNEEEGEEEQTDVYDGHTEFTFFWKEIAEIAINENIQIKVVDFGNGCWVDKHFTSSIQTREYRSPEVIIGSQYEANTDMWSLACILFELLTGDFLFKPTKDRPTEPKNEKHVALMIATLGPIPKHVAGKGKWSRAMFNKKGSLLHCKVPERYSISQILNEEYDFVKKDAEEIEAFLMPMLDFDIEKRISAKDALELPWLNGV